MPKSSSWTPERDNILAALWATDASAGEIAAEMGSVSRAAVLGRAWRLGLPPKKRIEAGKKNAERREQRRASEASRHRRRRATARPDIPLPEPKPDAIEHRNLTFAEIGEFDCRWITNEDLTAPLYCGHQVKPGTSWCPHHHDRVNPPRESLRVTPEGLAAMRRAGRETAERNRAKYRDLYDAEVA